MTRLRWQLEGAIQVLLAGLVVWTSLAVGNIRPLNLPVGRAVRWAVLAELCAVAVLYALLRRQRPRVTWTAVLAASFCALALLSTAWSPDPSLTFGRAVTLAVLFVAAGALALGTAGRPVEVGQILLGVLAGAVIVAIAGLLVLVVDSDRALVPATLSQPALYKGLGSNPNTMALLFAITLPLTVWALLEAQSRLGRGIAAAAFVVFDLSVAFSGSRGAAVAAFAGLVVLGLVSVRPAGLRLRLVGAAAALLLVNVVLMELPPAADRNPVLNPEFGVTPQINERDAQFILPLENEIGFPGFGATKQTQGVFGTSGRAEAWRMAIGQAAERPVVGYGFGTEERVFVDRLYSFLADRPENSFVGTALQLGVVGLVLLVALLAVGLVAGLRGLARLGGSHRRVAGACAAVVVSGLVLAVTQSYLTSVGSPPTLPFWLALFLLAALAPAAGVVPAFQERNRHEREVEAANGHGEAGLDVVGGDHDRVGEQEEDDAARRAPA